jgi:hypothetical protein
LTRTSTMSPWVAITTLSNTSTMGRIIAKGRVVEGTRIISYHVQQCIAEKYGQWLAYKRMVCFAIGIAWSLVDIPGCSFLHSIWVRGLEACLPYRAFAWIQDEFFGCLSIPMHRRGFLKAVFRIILMECVEHHFEEWSGESNGAGALIPNLRCDEACILAATHDNRALPQTTSLDHISGICIFRSGKTKLV